jgi:hypothetical protein
VQKAVAACLALFALACTPTVATTWGYSSWYRRGSPGAGDMGAFEAQRNTCLSELQVPDPAALAPRSREERQFLQCMNAAGWCTQMWDCDSP